MPTLGDWHHLLTPPGQHLLTLCHGLDLGTPASIERLRRHASPEQVAAAIELTRARSEGLAKFGPAIHTMICDREGVQMASSPAIADYKSQRFKHLLNHTDILDLCSGIGADTMALTAAGLDPLAVDLDPVRAWMTEQNAACRTLIGDVASLSLPCIPLHIDPQRRVSASHSRIPTLADLTPEPGILWRLVFEHPACCVKLFPGVPFEHLPPGEIELISENRRLRQALLWTGPLAQHARSATTFPTGDTIAGRPGPAPLGPIKQFIFAIDPAVERAELIGHLAGTLDLHTPHPASGLLTGSALIASPFLTAFEVIEFMPWSLARVREALASRGAGIVEIKTRGGVVDPDIIQHKLRGNGSLALTVFILRFDRQLSAIITHRVVAAPHTDS